jgi:hypothetical protein
MLLSPALGGDSKTSVVVCGSMDIEDAKETVQVHTQRHTHCYHIYMYILYIEGKREYSALIYWCIYALLYNPYGRSMLAIFFK